MAQGLTMMLGTAARRRLKAAFTALSGFRALRTPGAQRIRHAVRRRWSPGCALCKKPGPTELAHVVPVEEGGEFTCENLVPLCVRGQKTLARALFDPERVGCHHLYDNEGFWCRNEIARLARDAPASSELARPTQVAHDETRVRIESLIAAMRYRRAQEAIQRAEGNFSTLDFAILTLRNARRRSGRDRVDAISSVATKLETEHKRLVTGFEAAAAGAREEAADDLERLEYERGMIAFQRRCFGEAEAWFRRYEERDRGSQRGGWLINAMQAGVAAFEDARRTGAQPRDPAKLAAIVAELDARAVARPQHEALQAWRVTSRLQLARMYASACSPSVENAKSSIAAAEAIRDGQRRGTGWRR